MSKQDIEDAHEVMRTHITDDGYWCNVCPAGRYPCITRRDATSRLIREGHLVLADAGPRKA
jgi:hypothetical protein